MKHHDHYHCDFCSAEFATEQEVDQHQREEHGQDAGAESGKAQGKLRADATRQADGDDNEPPRKGREFTRSHRE